MSATAPEITAEQLLNLLRSGGCDHSERLPLYLVGDRWCCDRCVGAVRQELEAEEQVWRIREANPRLFAPQLIERARGDALTQRELDEVRRCPADHLRRYGLGSLLA